MQTIDRVAFTVRADAAQLRETPPDQWSQINKVFRGLLRGDPVAVSKFEDYGITVEFLDLTD